MQILVQSEVQPWQSYTESTRVKYSDGRVMQNKVEEGRVKVELCLVKQSEVE